MIYAVLGLSSSAQISYNNGIADANAANQNMNSFAWEMAQGAVSTLNSTQIQTDGYDNTYTTAYEVAFQGTVNAGGEYNGGGYQAGLAAGKAAVGTTPTNPGSFDCTTVTNSGSTLGNNDGQLQGELDGYEAQYADFYASGLAGASCPADSSGKGTAPVDTSSCYQQGFNSAFNQDSFDNVYPALFVQAEQSVDGDAYATGSSSGQSQGTTDGSTAGYTDGYAVGMADQQAANNGTAYNTCFTTGYVSGYTNGYNAGYADPAAFAGAVPGAGDGETDAQASCATSSSATQAAAMAFTPSTLPRVLGGTRKLQDLPAANATARVRAMALGPVAKASLRKLGITVSSSVARPVFVRKAGAPGPTTAQLNYAASIRSRVGPQLAAALRLKSQLEKSIVQSLSGFSK